MKKGIILVQDPYILELVTKAFPDWLVLNSNIPQAIEFYPLPSK